MGNASSSASARGFTSPQSMVGATKSSSEGPAGSAGASAASAALNAGSSPRLVLNAEGASASASSSPRGATRGTGPRPPRRRARSASRVATDDVRRATPRRCRFGRARPRARSTATPPRRPSTTGWPLRSGREIRDGPRDGGRRAGRRRRASRRRCEHRDPETSARDARVWSLVVVVGATSSDRELTERRVNPSIGDVTWSDKMWSAPRSRKVRSGIFQRLIALALDDFFRVRTHSAEKMACGKSEFCPNGRAVWRELREGINKPLEIV